ncbi:cell growth regulator with RING finger domain protein 1 isoform X1 [Eurytemora carolleeae]|uniref:cell growth regulator with RING finger domain protein 1 isoform X1 n=2 Tax=Eurytemora carolleeae TaxID=1294199 RepID=UPI000C783C9C|nr:cell growth regulator with RING finger domain protein 1 isoform X1 [Eurytemora carolleeae]|eukprot:XP_023331444.1 cell growth regulator with RING finger domain protein 1-like isoform X1 [Eurytemora affinis]
MIIENGGCLRIEGDFNAAMWMLAVLGSKLWMSSGMRMTEWLVSVAEVSNLVSFLAVLISFTVMFFFIIKLIGQDLIEGGGLTRVTHAPPRINFTKVCLPFRVKLIGVKEPYRIEVSISSVSVGQMRVFWGVDIQSFHQVLRAPKDWFLSAYTHGNLFGQDKCMELGKIEQIDKMDDRLVTLTKPTDAPLELGPAPRDVYPCVLVLQADQETILTVIHVQDLQCTVPSQILSEYYKSGSSSTLLQSVYLAASDIGESSDTESQAETDAEEMTGVYGRAGARCIICQQSYITRVVLPCRHATSCSKCFKRLQNCPMCRGFIHSYFLIGSEPREDDISVPTDNHQESRGFRDFIRRIRFWTAGPLVMNDND